MRSFGPWAVNFKISPQWQVLLLEISLGLLCLVAIWIAVLEFWVELILVLLVVANTAYWMAREVGFFKLGAQAIVGMRFVDPEFEVALRSGETIRASIGSRTVIWGSLVFLDVQLRPEALERQGLWGWLLKHSRIKSRSQILLTPSGIGREEYRRLVVLLRYKIKNQMNSPDTWAQDLEVD